MKSKQTKDNNLIQKSMKLLFSPLTATTPEEEFHFFNLLEKTSAGNVASIINENFQSNKSFPFLTSESIDGNKYLFFQKDYSIKKNLETLISQFLKKTSLAQMDTSRFDSKLFSLTSTFANNSGLTKFQLSLEQKSAIYNILTTKFQLVIGGPGTGKTSVISFLLKLMAELNELPPENEIVLVAPTGRAAQRLTESIQRNLTLMDPEQKLVYKFKGQTLHSLLRINPQTGKVHFGKDRYLTQSLFILDEVSMVDLRMMNLFFEAMKDGNRIILLGDPNQLPSVEKGNILSDLIQNLEGKTNFVSRLTESKRFDPDSYLSKISLSIQNSFSSESHGFNLETIPDNMFDPHQTQPKEKNIFWLKSKENSEINLNNRDEVMRYLWRDVFYPDILSISKLDWTFKTLGDQKSVQTFETFVLKQRCLTIFRKNYFGLESIQSKLMEIAESTILKNFKNHQIQNRRLNQFFYFEGMPILIEKNDKIRKLFNGDIGLVIKIEEELRAVFLIDNQLNSFALDTLPDHSPAFFLTVHKSQGSEYDRVFLYIPPVQETKEVSELELPILNRQILFTAITRAKKEVILIGDKFTWDTGLQLYQNRITGFHLDI